VRLWDLGGGRHVELTGHEGPVHAAAISPAGDRIASAGADHTIRLWRPDGRPQRILKRFHAPAWAVSFLAGGQLVAAAIGNRLDANEPGGVYVWRTTDDTQVQYANESTGAWTLAAAPEHKRLAWGNGCRRITIWDLTTPDRHVIPPLKTAAVALTMSRDGRLLAAGDDWAIVVWDAVRREQIASLDGHRGRVTTLAFTPDGQLLSGSADRRVITWDLESRRKRSSVDWDVGWITALAVSPDGLLVAAAADKGRIVAWDRE
jgi:WD40 repeat protein